ncbi:MAG: hypothetical protein WD002_15195 [Pseudomonadales bacterium]
MATENNLKDEMDVLKADLAKLRGDVGELVDLLKSLGEEKVSDAKSSLDDELERRRAELRAALSGARVRGEKAVDALEGEIAQHPFSTVLAAFGIGFLVSKLLDVGRHH